MSLFFFIFIFKDVLALFLNSEAVAVHSEFSENSSCLSLLLHWKIYWFAWAFIPKIPDIQSFQRLTRWQSSTPKWGWKWGFFSVVWKCLSQHVWFTLYLLVKFDLCDIEKSHQIKGKAALQRCVFVLSLPASWESRWFSWKHHLRFKKVTFESPGELSLLSTMNERPWWNNPVHEGWSWWNIHPKTSTMSIRLFIY